MKKELYNAIYRLFDSGDYKLKIKVGSIDLSLYDCDNPETDNIWNSGIVANGEIYTLDRLHLDRLGPGTLAQLFSGEYDIIDGFTEKIYNDRERIIFKNF